MARKRKKQAEASGINKGTSAKAIRRRTRPVEQASRKRTAIIYGRSGTGKTTFASTLIGLDPVLESQGDKILMLDMREEGVDSICDVVGVEEFKIETWSDFEGVYWFLRDSDHHYKGYIGDTITQLQGLAMNESKIRADIDPEAAMTKRSWGFLGSMLGPMLLDFRSLPLHSCFVAQDRHSEVEIEADDDEDTLLPEVGPALMPSVAVTANAMVSIIGQTYVKKIQKKSGGKLKSITQFRMRLGPHPYYLTKIRTSRSNRVPGSIPDPTFMKVDQIMRGTYAVPKQKKAKR